MSYAEPGVEYRGYHLCGIIFVLYGAIVSVDFSGRINDEEQWKNLKQWISKPETKLNGVVFGTAI
ncbi:hypothetical protein FACS1894200_02190 [Spirochaetia bacterium]|nr:hypothetical protein FACS1894200_02190 [Spirochaetia bacterium]